MKINEFARENVIVNCDDFAISKGVDETVLGLCKIGALSSVSVFVTTDRFEKSIEELKKTQKEFGFPKIGLHLSLTFGKALTIAGKSLITDESGNFNRSFEEILLFSIFKKAEMAKLIEGEIYARFEKLQGVLNVSKIEVCHVDGHQHIHTIPLVFGFVKNLEVGRVRIVNEKFWQRHLLDPKNWVGALKLGVLRGLGVFNREKSDVYFVSIFRTCKIDMDFIMNYNVPKGFRKVEIMVHVGNSGIDAGNETKERPHLTNKWRDLEANFVRKFLREFKMEFGMEFLNKKNV